MTGSTTSASREERDRRRNHHRRPRQGWARDLRASARRGGKQRARTACRAVPVARARAGHLHVTSRRSRNRHLTRLFERREGTGPRAGFPSLLPRRRATSPGGPSVVRATRARAGWRTQPNRTGSDLGRRTGVAGRGSALCLGHARTSAANCSPVMPASACTLWLAPLTLSHTRSAISAG